MPEQKQETVNIMPDPDFMRKSMITGLNAEENRFILEFQRDHKVLQRTNGLVFNLVMALLNVTDEDSLREVQEAGQETLRRINEAWREAQQKYCDGEVFFARIRGSKLAPCQKELDEEGFCSDPHCDNYIVRG